MPGTEPLLSPATPSVEVCLTDADLAAMLAADVSAGLTSQPKRLPPKWLYDDRGCELFDAITELPEYYPTRTERAILAAHAPEIADRAGASTLIELGSGTSEKTGYLIDAMLARTLRRFVAFDVAESTLRAALDTLSERYPALQLAGVVGDFELHLDRVPAGPGRMVAFLGGTIGNLERPERASFLSRLAAVLTDGEWLLLGTDLVKDRQRLVAAYDDSAGVTAEFERNALAVVNRQLGADFDLGCYDYVARWDDDRCAIEMSLRATRDQQVTIADLDLSVEVAEGEEIGTEISTKFTVDGIGDELERGGLTPVQCWTDPAGDFAVTLAQRRS